MQFVPSDDPAAIEAAKHLDVLLDDLLALDVMARRGTVEGDVAAIAQASNGVGNLISGISWGGMPTFLMHAVGHVAMARNEAGRLAESLKTGADALTQISQILNNADVPVGVCAQIMDLAVSLRESAEATIFEPIADGGECQHE